MKVQEQNIQGESAYKSKEEALSHLDDGLQKLAKVGGFSFLENTIDGLQNINPERKARKNIFMTDPEKKKERQELKRRLQIWLDLLENSSSPAEITEKCLEKVETGTKVLNKNIGKALESYRDLEQAYRSVALFYKNTESDKIKNITI